jgi:hypothetical protein
MYLNVDISVYIRIYPGNIQMYPHVSRMYLDISGCIRIYPDITRMHMDISGCIQMYLDISRYILDISGYIWIYLYPDTSGFIGIYPGFQDWAVGEMLRPIRIKIKI